MTAMGRVLVTGGAGFIGANLCRRLLRDPGCRVLCLDNLSTGSLDSIDDLLDGMLRLAVDTPDDFTGPLNLGSAREYSIRELADVVVKVTGSRSRIETVPQPPNLARVRCPEIGLAERVIGWEPKVRLEEGLGKTASYFRRRLAAAETS